jgi:ADP-heptose:LPS heptosyltransferase
LVVKVHDQLGDFLLSTPALRALREFYPRARLGLVTREFLAPLARRNRDLDRVWVLPEIRSPRDLFGLAVALGGVARFRPDLAFVFNSVSRSKSSDALATLSRARLVVGRSLVFAGPQPAEAPENPFEVARRRKHDPVYDLDLDSARGSDHQVERYLDLVGWTGAAPSTPGLRLDLDPEERRAGREALLAAEALTGAEGSPGREASDQRRGRGVLRVGLHPGAANPLKCWPLESFVALGVSLAHSMPRGLTIAVFDSPRERGRAAAVCAGLEVHGVRAAFLPAGAIDRFAAICSQLELLVCNDSGVMHIAAGLGIPTVSFHSLGRPVEWGPWGAGGIAMYAAPSINQIPVPAALAATLGLLRASGPGPDQHLF